MYAKYGGGGVCIEHFGQIWQVKRVEDRGGSACMASVAGGCALVDCVARIWYRASPNGPTEDIRMKISTGDDAEQEVSGCCISRIKSTDHHQCFHSRVHALTCALFVPAVREDTRRANPSRCRSTHTTCRLLSSTGMTPRRLAARSAIVVQQPSLPLPWCCCFSTSL